MWRNVHNYRSLFDSGSDLFDGAEGVGERIENGDEERLHRQCVSEQGLEGWTGIYKVEWEEAGEENILEKTSVEEWSMKRRASNTNIT